MVKMLGPNLGYLDSMPVRRASLDVCREDLEILVTDASAGVLSVLKHVPLGQRKRRQMYSA